MSENSVNFAFESGQRLLDTTPSPEQVRTHVQALHTDDQLPIDTPALDKLILGGKSTDLDAELLGDDRYDLRRRFPTEMPWNGTNEGIWTPYGVIRMIVTKLDLTKEDTFYDLGSGYGRLPLYVGITTLAAARGIEMVGERVAVAQRAKDRLGLSSVEFIEGNVLEQDYSDGNVFYTYAPFKRGTFKKVLSRLEEIAALRRDSGKGPITIASRGCDLYDQQDWLRHTAILSMRPFTVSIFQSTTQSTVHAAAEAELLDPIV